MDGNATTPVATRLSRSTPEQDAFIVLVAGRRILALVTAHPDDVRRWIRVTCSLLWRHLSSGRLVVGLGVQWTPFRGRPGDTPATLQLCVNHRCLVLHLARLDADSLPHELYDFLADPRVIFVGYANYNDRRMLWDHYGLHVASARNLRDLAGMGNPSLERMAHRFLGYTGIGRPSPVAVSAWHAARLSVEQVEYACVHAYLAYRLGVHLCAAAPPPAQRAPVMAPHAPPRGPVLQPHRAPAPALGLPRAPAPPPATRAQWIPRVRPAAPALVLQPHRAPAPALVLRPRAPPLPATRAQWLPRLRPDPPAPLRSLVVDAAESSSRTRPGFTGSDTETDLSPSSGDLDLEDRLRRKQATDDEEEEEDVYGGEDGYGQDDGGDWDV